MPVRLRHLFWILATLSFVLPPTAFGHNTGLSTTDLKFGTNGLAAEVIMAGADLKLVLAHLEAAQPFDANRDGKLTQEEFTAALERVRKLALDCMAVEFDGQAIRPGPPTLSFDDKDNFLIELNYPGKRPGRLRLRTTLFEYLPPDHMHFVSVQDGDGKPLGNKMLRSDDNSMELTLSGQVKTERRVHTFADFLRLGIEHIWTGYDHLMFLLALLLVCGNFKSAVQVVTFFTVAHSITLAFATLNLVWISSRVVEPAIAASIVYVGVENFVRSEGPKGRWLITFLFGLIHGFGFATVLRDMGVASSTTGVTVPLVAFNLGVEAGQVVIAGVLLPVIWRLRKWDLFVRRGVPVCSATVAAIGAYWLIQRLAPN